MWWPFGPSPKDSSSPSSSSTLSSLPSPSVSDARIPVAQAEAKLPTSVRQGLTRDEQANLDFAELLKEIEIEQAKEQERRDQVRKGPSRSTPTTIDIAPDALYPTEMSCRSALDYAMFCQSFGGQFVNVYRYGEFRSCKNHWSDFWLCMRTRNWDEKDRAAAVQSHYKTKAVKWKSGPSSEDIWEVRTEPVRDAFQDNLEDLEAKIAAWKQANPDVPDPWDKRQGSTFNNQPPAA